jgi:peptidoglycan/LPS O-acetylase OafA/YrhL
LLPVSNWFRGPYITWHIKTLHVEETYYVVVSLCAFMLRRRLRTLLWWLLIAAPLGRIALFVMGKLGSTVAFWWLDRYLPVEAFAIGGLLALNLGRVRALAPVQAMIRKPTASFVLAMSALLVCAGLRDVKPFSYLLLFTWPLLFSLLSAVMIVSGLEARSFFASEWMRRVGLASYSLYLFQQFVFGPWREVYGTAFSWPLWFASLGGLILLLPLWYGFAERPLTDLGADWFPRTARKLPSTGTAVAETVLAGRASA